MTVDDPRNDVPEADLAEQEQELVPEEDDETAEETPIDPLQGNEADLLEQRRSVPGQDDDYDR